MKKLICILLALLVIVVGYYFSSHNQLISAEEAVDARLSDITVMLKRRADLIPNLIATVQAYADHEQSVIDSVTEARTKLLAADGVSALSEADAELSQAVGQLLVIAESYPTLTANENFIQLQDELAGSENRIAVARKDYNEAVQRYNKLIKSFPTKLIAESNGLTQRDYFTAKEAVTDVPVVSFN